jgi:hypothetical protein
MISRREVVTAGMLGTLSNAAMAAPAEPQGPQGSQDNAGMQTQLGEIRKALTNINGNLDAGLRGPGLSFGYIGEIRERFTIHLRSSGKFPDFMEIGTSPFYDVYDWHIRHNQQIQIIRISEQRFAIQFMFTQLVVRWEQDPRYLGQPYDRG